jgi:hypothetical protein
LLLGALGLANLLRRRSRRPDDSEAASPLTEAERVRLAELLDDGAKSTGQNS